MHKIRDPELVERIRAASKDSPLLRGTSRDFPKSRVQKLRTLDTWLKRDDELSFTVSGPKFRKLCGMTEIFKSERPLVSYGSCRSAFLFALAQQATSLGRQLELYLLKSTPWKESGADKLYKAVYAEHRVHFVEREDWADIESLLPKDAQVIPEGGVSKEALWGVMSLGLDIAEQMEEFSFENIWVDAGTGLTAKAVILSLGTMLENPPHVHVVLCAGDEGTFVDSLKEGGLTPAPFTLHRPPTARSYGATNAAVWEIIDRYLRTEGVLLDPIYTAKLMLAYEAHPKDSSIDLIVHSGGGLNNFGF